MGGDVLDVEVSAVTRKGLDTLLENIALQSEILISAPIPAVRPKVP